MLTCTSSTWYKFKDAKQLIIVAVATVCWERERLRWICTFLRIQHTFLRPSLRIDYASSGNPISTDMSATILTHMSAVASASSCMVSKHAHNVVHLWHKGSMILLRHAAILCVAV